MSSFTDARSCAIRRVVVVVLDGLRPDCLDVQRLPHLERLMGDGASTRVAQTVRPSVTAAAMGSLLTGVSPRVHGLESDRFHLPRRLGPIDPLPRVLAAHGIPSFGHLRRMPWAFRGIARRIAQTVGFGSVRFAGTSATEILRGAVDVIASMRHGLLLMHWPDADDAGHAHGWMSAPYRLAALSLDSAMGELRERLAHADADGTLLIALADHGGGGVVADSHEAVHPLNTTIPIVLCGAGITAGALPHGCSLLDVPATVLDAFGVAQPAGWEGMSLLPFAGGRDSAFAARMNALAVSVA
jgi:predicted AlkP superfamily pyrophosphatase or phosphodiesterase